MDGQRIGRRTCIWNSSDTRARRYRWDTIHGGTGRSGNPHEATYVPVGNAHEIPRMMVIFVLGIQ